MFFFKGIKNKENPHPLNKPFRRQGFTFVEFLISCLILALVVGSIFVMFHTAETSWNADTALFHLSQQSRIAMDGMVREIREGKNVTITNQTIMDFDITRGSTTYPIRYSFNNNTSQITRVVDPVNATITQVLINNINDLQFNRTGSSNNTISIEIKAGTTLRGRDYSVSLNEQVLLRN